MDEHDAIRSARNEILLRKYNEQLETARHMKVQPSVADWLCECADSSCAEPVKMTIPEYEALRADPTHFLVAPGPDHVSPGIEDVVRRDERYWVVAKFGVSAEMSIREDPRRFA